MIYNQLRPLAFQFASSEKLLCDYYTLEFPEKWKDLLRSLQALARKRGSHPTGIPITTLNKALRALVPDLISIARNAHFSGSRPWLYSRQEINTEELFRIVRAWVKTNFKTNEQNRGDAIATMSAKDLQWEKQARVNLASWTLADNGTAEWQDKFLLLADEIAARISKKYEFECDSSLLKFCTQEEVTFLRASQPIGGRGAELVSWPPFCYQSKGKEWYFSALLTITVQTVPFCAFPVINIDVGVRRWCGEEITYIPGGEDTSVYLLAKKPWISDSSQSSSFSIAPIRYRKETYEWGSNLADLLEELQSDNRFPSPVNIKDNPKEALKINSDKFPSAAVVFRNGIRPWHKVEAGVMPVERSMFAEQIAEILKPDFKFTELLDRVNFSFPNRKNLFDNENPDSQRLQRIGEAVRGQLTVEIWYQSEKLRDNLIKVVGDCLGIQETPPSLPHTWETPELKLTLRAEPLGELGDALKLNDSITRLRDRLHKAIAQRCNQIERIPLASGATVALIELGGESAFSRHADPKYAIRLGFAQRNRLTQFINSNAFKPVSNEDKRKKSDEEKREKSEENRNKSAVKDALRQLGVWPLYAEIEYKRPRYNKPLENLPLPELNCVGLWTIKHYPSSSPTRVHYILPVMVYLEWYTGTICAIAPGFDEWLPYREALLAIAQGKAQGYNERQQANNWILQTINNNLPKNTLLICHAQNLRQVWSELKNSNLKLEHLTLGDAKPIHISKFQGLRVVRLRDSGGHETPEWYAINGDKKGFSEGIFRINERVFASTAQKSAQQTSLNNNLFKFSRWEVLTKDDEVQWRDPQPNKPAWNPQLIEITVSCIQKNDKPEDWAALVHELRQVALQYQDATHLPFPLHLASKMEEYTLPVRFEEEDEDAEEE